MKTRACGSILVATLFALAIPASVLAQEQHQTAGGETGQHHHYKLFDMGTFGGPLSGINEPLNYVPAVNRRGQTVGFSANSMPQTVLNNPAACFGPPFPPPNVTHAFERKDDTVTDLGSLAGPAFCSDANSINERGEIQGLSEIDVVDPVLGFYEMRAVVWKHGRLINLGTLGGDNSWAFGINNRGEVVGLAQNAVPDPYSILDFVIFGGVSVGTQTRAFLWQEGVMRDLGTLGGPDAWALGINERGQVAGQSYVNSAPNPTTGFPTLDPFFWDKGEMRDLGSLGGVVGFVEEMNNRGQIIGGSSTAESPGACLSPGGIEFLNAGCDPYFWDGGEMIDLRTHTAGGTPFSADAINDVGEIVGAATFPDQLYDAYLRRHGTAIDLGHLAGDCSSEAWAINVHSQVVGDSFSCGSTFQHAAFLWEGGSLADLNTLIPSGSSLQLVFATAINDRGEIAGNGVPLGVSPGDVFALGHAYLLIPCDENHPDIDGCDYSLVDAKAAMAAQAVRGTRDSKWSAAGQASGPLSGMGALPAARESTSARQLLLQRLGFARFTGRLFPFTSDPALTSGPSATLSPASLTFSTQAVGTTSAAETVALKNTGTTSLTISSIAITGTDHADFTQTHTCGTSLAAGASCSISVEFSPTASGTRTAILSVTDNAAGSPQKVSLAGIGTTAKVSPTSLYFGAVGIGATSPAQFVTLTNVGTTTLAVTGITITGADAADFAHNNCASSLAPGWSCNIRVTFTPTALGTRAAMLSVTDNAAGSPQKVSLTGVGTTARLSPTSLYFASVTVGMSSPAQIVTLTNVGTTTLTVTGIAIAGTNAADFVQSHNCASSLAAGASCSISVTFKPKAYGLRNATLSVSDSASGRPQTVSLCGGCIPYGGSCFGPGPNRCCPAPRGHFAICSDPTGWGTCVEI